MRGRFSELTIPPNLPYFRLWQHPASVRLVPRKRGEPSLRKGVDYIPIRKLFILAVVFVLLAVPVRAVENYDLTAVSPLTAEQLKPYMHPETQHLAQQVTDLCAENGLSAEFIIAVMRLERNPSIHNYFGWSWGDGSLVVFDSDEECLSHCIPLIKSKYLTEGGEYFNGTTVYGVSINYNNTDEWREFILAELDWMFENIATLPHPSETKIQMYQQFLHTKFS